MIEVGQGRRSAAAGVALDQNPYRPGTRGHAAWAKGWVSATDDLEVAAEVARRRTTRRDLAEAFDELGRTLLASPVGRLLEAAVMRLAQWGRRLGC